MAWEKTEPRRDGGYWCWVQYQGKYDIVTCPAEMIRGGDCSVLHSAKNDLFFKYEDGIWRHWAKPIESLRFGPIIEEPR